MDNLVRAVSINVSVSYFDGKQYSFKFVVNEKGSTMMIAYIASLLPQEDLLSLKIDKGSPNMLSESSIDNESTIEEYMNKTFNLGIQKLKLEKGE